MKKNSRLCKSNLKEKGVNVFNGWEGRALFCMSDLAVSCGRHEKSKENWEKQNCFPLNFLLKKPSYLLVYESLPLLIKLNSKCLQISIQNSEKMKYSFQITKFEKKIIMKKKRCCWRKMYRMKYLTIVKNHIRALTKENLD